MTNHNDDNTRTQVVLTQGKMVQHYRIIEKIGAGGMGEVYLAEDTKLKRRVALKFMPAHLAADDDMRSRFTREAQAAAKLDHPNIVPVYEVGEFQNRPFIAMAHIEGETLRDVIKKGKLSLSESIDLTMQICEGLNEAHNAGIVHRDIKPSNIIIDNSNRARLLDFGLATVSGEDKLTKTGSTLGTVGYMAPEQIVCKKVDKRADLFSVGVIFYEMITGRRPFTGDNDAAVVKAITDSNPEPIARFKSGVTGELQQIINKALSKDPSMRYQHADEMLADLKRLNIESKGPRKSRAALWAAAAVIIVVGGYFISILRTDTQEPTQAAAPVLVVLPFENLGSMEDDYFSVGIREEIGSRLMTVEGLRVISPRSADKYKNTKKSFEEIGQETGADYILEATIRWDKSGEIDRFRVTPKLTKASDNYLIWADNYDQELVQIFEVQSQIANKIVVALGLTLLKPGQDAPDYAPTSNMAAYNFYLRGIEIAGQNWYMSDFRKSIRMQDSAIALDSNFALAWAQKSINHSEFTFTYTTVEATYHREEALKAAEKALALNPSLPIAHIARGIYYNMVENDYDKALASFAMAKSEITSNAELSEAVGIVRMRQGRWQDALSKFEEAARIDPLSGQRYFYLATANSMLRDYESADQYLRRALALDPSNVDAAFFMVMINLLQHGSIDTKDTPFNKLTEDAGWTNISTYELASSTSLGLWRFIIDRIDPLEAIERLREMTQERSTQVRYMNIAQLFDLMGERDSALIYFDSSRIFLNNIIDQGSAEFHAYAELGLTYAKLGMNDLAIDAGKTAKEVMPVDLCHW